MLNFHKHNITNLAPLKQTSLSSCKMYFLLFFSWFVDEAWPGHVFVRFTPIAVSFLHQNRYRILQKESLKNKYKYFQDWFTVTDSLQTRFNNPTPTLFFFFSSLVNLDFSPQDLQSLSVTLTTSIFFKNYVHCFLFQSISRMNK